MMKCGLFPLRAKVPILKSTRLMHRDIKKLRLMGYEAVRNARTTAEKGDQDSKMIFEILAQ